MTSRRDELAVELARSPSQHIGRGEWPWSFFCYLEDVPRPVTPSAFRLLAPSTTDGRPRRPLPACATTSVNLVTPSHVDVPFHSDAQSVSSPTSFERGRARHAPSRFRPSSGPRPSTRSGCCSHERRRRSLPGGIIGARRGGRCLGVWSQPSTTKPRWTRAPRPAPPARLPRARPAGRRRPPAKVRLEEALGPELARKLVSSLRDAEPPGRPSAWSSAVARVVVAARPHDEEHEEAGDEREHERRPLRDRDREHPEVEEEEEHDRPEEALDAAVDGRHAQVHERS